MKDYIYIDIGGVNFTLQFEIFFCLVMAKVQSTLVVTCLAIIINTYFVIMRLVVDIYCSIYCNEVLLLEFVINLCNKSGTYCYVANNCHCLISSAIGIVSAPHRGTN